MLFLIVDARDRGWLPWEKSLFALSFATPLFGRQVTLATMIPLDLCCVLVVFALALRRAWRLDLQQQLPWHRAAQTAA